eukprot:48562-Chlamydomonas_euryale.AAC.1
MLHPSRLRCCVPAGGMQPWPCNAFLTRGELMVVIVGSAIAPAAAPERVDINLVGQPPVKKQMILPKNVRR